MSATSSVAEELSELEQGDHADLRLADHGRVSAYVTAVETEQDGLAGVAKQRLKMATFDGRTITVVLEFEAHSEDLSLEFASLIDDSEQYVEIEAVEPAGQQTLPTGGDST